MILLKLSIFFLLTFTPTFIYGQKKMVLIVPRQVRRETGMMAPWRQFNRHPELLDNDISSSLIRGTNHNYNHNHNHNPTNHLQAPYHFVNGNPRFRLNKNLVPLLSSHGNKQQPTNPGGVDDDFNNNGPVNHILIPHDKGITHALSFGKGYVPHDALTGSTYNVASSQDNHPSQSVSQLPSIANHNSNYNYNSYSQNNQNSYDLTAERKLEEIKALIFKAKQLGLLNNNNNDDYNSNEKSIMARDVESFSQNNYDNTNNNDKKGIIIRDTILYDDYNKKILELARNWPTHVFNNNNNNKNMGIINVAEVAAQHGINLPAQLLRHINFNNGGVGNNNLLKQTSGYAVNEQVQDIPQDYNRYKPIADIRANPTAVATAAAIVATGAQAVPQVPHLGHNQQNSHFHPGYFSLHSPTAIFNK